MSILDDGKTTPASDGLAALESGRSTAETFGIPLAVLAEVTHRCPLQCPYCSNPVELDRAGAELSTEEWKKVLSELAEIGVLQIHFSGGEPTARKDLVELVRHASDVGLYSNLITSAVLLTREKLAALADAGKRRLAQPHLELVSQHKSNDQFFAFAFGALTACHRRGKDV